MKQVYLEGVLGHLTPVEHITQDTEDPYSYRARIAETMNGYHKHEVIIRHKIHFVTKTGSTRAGFILVSNYILPKEGENHDQVNR